MSLRECFFIAILPSLSITAFAEEQARPNFVIIILDDLNDWVGPLRGHPQVQTPNLDRLAKRGMTFLNAHCQAPLCNPSRASLLLGLRPSTTGIYGLAPWFRTLPELKERATWPQMLAKGGYRTITCGKIIHDAYPPDPKAEPKEFEIWGSKGGFGERPAKKFVNTPDPHPLVDWGPFPEHDEDCFDYDLATWASKMLGDVPVKGNQEHVPRNREPFLLCVGLRHPHVPCYVPAKWFELYPEDQVVLPMILRDDRRDTPAFSWFLHWKLPEPRLSFLEQSNEWKSLVRAYLASVSFADAQVGRILDTLEKSPLAENTIVIVTSDHGWHLGEKGITGKNTLWEHSTRVPLIIAGSGISQGSCREPVELLDLYPTICELAGIEPPKDIEGHSLVGLLKDPESTRPWPALTTHNPGNHSVRSKRFRYIRYADGSQELYDHLNDPHEWTNVVDLKEYAAIVEEQRRWIPKQSAPLAPGSAHRILELREGIPYWEGEPIIPDTSN